jgi:hypothetical protein
LRGISLKTHGALRRQLGIILVRHRRCIKWTAFELLLLLLLSHGGGSRTATIRQILTLIIELDGRRVLLSLRLSQLLHLLRITIARFLPTAQVISCCSAADWLLFLLLLLLLLDYLLLLQ